MLKKTKVKILFALTAVLAAGSITAAAEKAATMQDSESFLKNTGAEKLLYCETDLSQYPERHT